MPPCSPRSATWGPSCCGCTPTASATFPRGAIAARCPRAKPALSKPVPGDTAHYPEKYEYNDSTKSLHVGAGAFAPVVPAVYNFEVSGLKVVQSWLGYRMKNPKGKKSSPLDDIRPERWTGDFTTELLEVLWVLQATIAEYPTQAKLLAAVAKKPMIRLPGQTKKSKARNPRN